MNFTVVMPDACTAFLPYAGTGRAVGSGLHAGAVLARMGGKGRYECGRELCPWFFTMAYNLCRNEYRFRNIAVGFAEEVRGGPETYEEQPELRMDVRMFDRELSALLDKLPPEQRVLFALRYEEELTVPQLAEVMGIPGGYGEIASSLFIAILKKEIEGL